MTFREAAFERLWELIGLLVLIGVFLYLGKGFLVGFCVLGILSWPIRILKKMKDK